jgi:O-antigen/teichoic acid export membrane protein
MVEASLSSGMRWSGISMLGREVSRTVFTILLARLVGPEEFGIAAQAMAYVGIVSLLLDQGFSSALIQRKDITPELPGAIVSVNVAIGGILTALTIAIASLWASFMRTPSLAMVLVALSPMLLIRSAEITPRTMLMRNMQFRKIALADAVAAISGGALGLAVAIIWASYWAVVVQFVSTDIVMLLVFLGMGAGYRPNLHFRQLREIAAFSWRAFAAGLLINSISRNIDSVLIGRFQGAQALAFYGMAYRLLLLPVQLATTSVGTVLLPVFSRLAHNAALLPAEMARATRALAALSLPAMALVAAAAPQLVFVIFGRQWEPAIPIVQVLAIPGAVQAIYKPSTAPLVLGVGRPRLILLYAWVTTIVSTVGIAVGLPFGPFGVAVGYSAATGLLLPVEWLIRRRILGMTIPRQVASLMPACHVAIWAAAAYLVVAIIIPSHELVVLAVGLPLAVLTGAAVLRFAHGPLWAELMYMTNRIIGRGGAPPALRNQPRHRAYRARRPHR